MNTSKFQYISFDYLASNFGNEKSFWKEILIDAVTNIEELIEEFKSCNNQQQWKQLGKTAHQLKGVVQIFGTEGLATMLKDIHVITEGSPTESELNPLVINCIETCSRVLVELKLANTELEVDK